MHTLPIKIIELDNVSTTLNNIEDILENVNSLDNYEPFYKRVIGMKTKNTQWFWIGLIGAIIITVGIIYYLNSDSSINIDNGNQIDNNLDRLTSSQTKLDNVEKLINDNNSNPLRPILKLDTTLTNNNNKDFSIITESDNTISINSCINLGESNNLNNLLLKKYPNLSKRFHW